MGRDGCGIVSVGGQPVPKLRHGHKASRNLACLKFLRHYFILSLQRRLIIMMDVTLWIV
jgi:hypothetical protein